ncbi:MAG: septum formation protein Maf [Elusimicrobia bacterium]|nr:septum formation protein Maf [Elusimicrobiota bacterium]
MPAQPKRLHFTHPAPAPFPLILASASPQRRELLRRCGVRFRVVPSGICERTGYRQPHRITQDLALQKAHAVAQRCPRGLVIGADTLVVLGRRLIGKPQSVRGAERILTQLSGTTHRVYTGIAVVDASTGRWLSDYEVTRVTMRRLSPGVIHRVARWHLDKSGAYAVQEARDPLVQRVEGDFWNVVGLPLVTLNRLLGRFGISLRWSSPFDKGGWRGICR